MARSFATEPTAITAAIRRGLAAQRGIPESQIEIGRHSNGDVVGLVSVTAIGELCALLLGPGDWRVR